MKPFLVVMVAFMGLFLVGVFVLAWLYDLQIENFRNNLESGTLVSYSAGYELKRGIVTEVLADEVKLVDCLTKHIYTVPKYKLYKP